MMVRTTPRLGRPLRVAALLTAGLLASPLLAQHASAIIAGCGGDPIVVLSDGVTIDLRATAATDASTVRQITYTLHAPRGTSVVSVTSLGVREVLHVAPDNAAGRYDTVTRVDADAADVSVTTATLVAPLTGAPATGSATGVTNQDLSIHLAP